MDTVLRLPASIKSSPLFPSFSFSSIFLGKPTRITGNFLSFGRTHNFSTVMASSKDHHGIQGGESFFRNVLAAMETGYLSKNPTAKAILELVRSVEDDRICYDHFAFRTFGVNNHGIDSMANFFLDFGYVQREELRFPAKKLKAFWFSPPDNIHLDAGAGVYGPLPRIFISELLVDQMSPETQKIIRKYSESSGNGVSHAALASALGSLTWNKPSYSEFQHLARESEYAAWTLVNGYALNHVTISTHRLISHLRTIGSLNQFIEENGFKLNSEGGVLKVSPDGLLLQSSTVADSSPFQFSDGITESVPCSYIEFAERLVLPQFKDLPENKSSTDETDSRLEMLTRFSRAHQKISLLGRLPEKTPRTSIFLVSLRDNGVDNVKL